MKYLTKELEALANRRASISVSLIKKEKSCGIFQDYGTGNVNKPYNDKS